MSDNVNIKEQLIFLIKKLGRDRIGVEASALTFKTLLALIPALSVILYSFAVIPFFEPFRESLKGFAQSNLMPVFADSLNTHIGIFLEHSSKLTITSTIFFFIVALSMIRSIDLCLNRIIGYEKSKFYITFLVYLALLILGPVSIGVIIWIFSKVMSFEIFSNSTISPVAYLLFLLFPIFIEASILSAIYYLVPRAKVKFKAAFIAAVVVTIAFEISKKLFAIFILKFTDYEAIYGAIAVIPVLFIWISLNWYLVLIGAELVYALTRGLKKS